MSVSVSTWAWFQKVKGATPKIVLVRLADIAGDSGNCEFVSGGKVVTYGAQRLAAECGIDPKTFRRAIKHLIDAGYVSVTSQKPGKPVHYKLNIDQFPGPQIGKQKAQEFTAPVDNSVDKGVGHDAPPRQNDPQGVGHHASEGGAPCPNRVGHHAPHSISYPSLIQTESSNYEEGATRVGNDLEDGTVQKLNSQDSCRKRYLASVREWMPRQLGREYDATKLNNTLETSLIERWLSRGYQRHHLGSVVAGLKTAKGEIPENPIVAIDHALIAMFKHTLEASLVGPDNKINF